MTRNKTGRSVLQNMYLIDRRGRKCELCGYSEHPEILEVHHIIPRCDGGKNEDSNLQVLCPNCHTLTDRSESFDDHFIRVKFEHRLRTKKWNTNNPERLKEISRKWEKLHKDKRVARRKELRKL